MRPPRRKVTGEYFHRGAYTKKCWVLTLDCGHKSHHYGKDSWWKRPKTVASSECLKSKDPVDPTKGCALIGYLKSRNAVWEHPDRKDRLFIVGGNPPLAHGVELADVTLCKPETGRIERREDARRVFVDWAERMADIAMDNPRSGTARREAEAALLIAENWEYWHDLSVEKWAQP